MHFRTKRKQRIAAGTRKYRDRNTGKHPFCSRIETVPILMVLNRLLALLICWISLTDVLSAKECSNPRTKEMNLALQSTQSLLSPDEHWKFLSVGAHSSESEASLYIQNTDNSKRWLVGGIERSGTAFWSEDSKRLFLRDEYAADDTKIRVFDVTGPTPKEIKGLNGKIEKTLFAHIPPNKTTQWLSYPKVCFAANDSSTIIVVADAPLVPKTGSGSGIPFNLTLTVNLVTLQVDSESIPLRNQQELHTDETRSWPRIRKLRVRQRRDEGQRAWGFWRGRRRWSGRGL